MNLTLLVSTLLFASSTIYAVDAPLSRSSYEQRFQLTEGTKGDQDTIKDCLARWGEHPFKSQNPLKFRALETRVTVLGIGSDPVVDDVATDHPQLILVRPSVKVLSKEVFELKNPNGWYCFKANVNVLSKGIIKAACNTHLADSSGSVAVIGSNSGGGVTVLGKSIVERDSCKI